MNLYDYLYRELGSSYKAEAKIKELEEETEKEKNEERKNRD